MEIRIATVDLLDGVVALLAAQFGEHAIGLGVDALRSAVRALVVDPQLGLVLVAMDPAPVGVAALPYCWTLEHGGRVMWLEELYVVPERRGQGIGAALLQRALDEGWARGCHAVDLEVDVEHARAERLYARAGFTSLPRARWSKRLG